MKISADFTNYNKNKIAFGEDSSDGDIPLTNRQRAREARVESLEAADAPADIYWREMRKLELEQKFLAAPERKSFISKLINIFKR